MEQMRDGRRPAQHKYVTKLYWSLVLVKSLTDVRYALSPSVRIFASLDIRTGKLQNELIVQSV
jgi:hypothetical protein